MVPQEIKQRDFEFEVLNSELPVLVNFYVKNWCEPCHDFAGVLRELARDYHVEFKVVRVDADKQPELAERYRIDSYPSLLVLDKGEVTAEIRGAQKGKDLRAYLDAYLKTRSKA